MSIKNNVFIFWSKEWQIHCYKKKGNNTGLKRSDKKNWLERIEHAKVETTVHNNTGTRDAKPTAETADSIRGVGLAIHINKAIESFTVARWPDGS
jgi:hypothetical protein